MIHFHLMKQWRLPIGWIALLCLIACIALAANGTARAADDTAHDVSEEKKTASDDTATTGFVASRFSQVTKLKGDSSLSVKLRDVAAASVAWIVHVF